MILFMTARRMQMTNTVQLETDTEPEQYFRNYIEELTSRGHDIKSDAYSENRAPQQGEDVRCKGCNRQLRIYRTTDPDKWDLVMFSDFHEGDQCPARQMNVHAPEVIDDP